MFLSLHDTLPEYDICIIGAGPAGMTIASELKDTGLKICVLESGIDKKSVFADELKSVESEGIKITEVSRERLVGGSSSVWGGQSAPLDEVDFASRPWTKGWPLSYKDLEPYMTMAEKYQHPRLSEFQREPLSGGHILWKNLEAKTFIITLPTYRFACLKPIFEKENFDLIIDATVTKLEYKNENNIDHILSAECRSSDNFLQKIFAKCFILAAGGIENSRLLLNSNIGNKYDQVGRYFMNHPFGRAGLLRLRKPLRSNSHYVNNVTSNRIVYSGLRLSPDFQRENNLLNSYVGFETFFGYWKTDSLLRRLHIIYEKVKSFVPNFLKPPVYTLRLRWFLEMEPLYDNRVTLSEKKDVFGIPIAKVTHSMSERDKKTVRVLFEQLKDNIEGKGIGKINDNIEDIMKHITIDASHHMGATRMGIDPQKSVVDLNSKVHGTSNLYIAGSSVFPTGGNANPTFTIVALAIRLAEYLKGK